MTDPSPQVEQDRDPTSHALSLLEGFRSRVLPGVLRRMSVWKRLEASGQQEVAADAMQELALDCLAHPQEVLALPARGRAPARMHSTRSSSSPICPPTSRSTSRTGNCCVACWTAPTT